MKHLLVLTVLTLFLTSCGPESVSVSIDNPTGDVVVVTIDNEVIEVPPRDATQIELTRGSHTVTTDSIGPTEFNFKEDAYFINPTMSEYLLFEEVYGASTIGESAGTMPHKTINYMGMELEGQYDVVRDLISQITWEYGPREATPEMVEIDDDETFAFFKKLADLGEVLDMMGYDPDMDYEDEEMDLDFQEEELELEEAVE